MAHFWPEKEHPLACCQEIWCWLKKAYGWNPSATSSTKQRTSPLSCRGGVYCSLGSGADHRFPITIQALCEHGNKILEHHIGPDFWSISANWTYQFLPCFPEVDWTHPSRGHGSRGHEPLCKSPNSSYQPIMTSFPLQLQEAVMRIPPERQYNMDEKSLMLGRLDRAEVLICRGSKPTQLQGHSLALVIWDHSPILLNLFDLLL